MSFPQKSKFLKRPVGWKDLGKKGSWYDSERKVYLTTAHSFCKTDVRIGKEGYNLFTYCPRCMVETLDKKLTKGRNK